MRTEMSDGLQQSLLFWIPANLIQFGLVPAKYQVLYVNFAGVGWGIILSSLSNHVRTTPGGNELSDLEPVHVEEVLSKVAHTVLGEKDAALAESWERFAFMLDMPPVVSPGHYPARLNHHSLAVAKTKGRLMSIHAAKQNSSSSVTAGSSDEEVFVHEQSERSKDTSIMESVLETSLNFRKNPWRTFPSAATAGLGLTYWQHTVVPSFGHHHQVRLVRPDISDAVTLAQQESQQKEFQADGLSSPIASPPSPARVPSTCSSGISGVDVEDIFAVNMWPSWVLGSRKISISSPSVSTASTRSPSYVITETETLPQGVSFSTEDNGGLSSDVDPLSCTTSSTEWYSCKDAATLSRNSSKVSEE